MATFRLPIQGTTAYYRVVMDGQTTNAGDRRPGFFSLKIRWKGLFVAATLVLTVASVLGFLGMFWWRFDLLAHFRVQYVVGFAVTTAYFALLRRWKTAAVLLGLCALNVALVIPLYLGRAGGAGEGGERLRVMLVNVHTSNRRFDSVKALIRKEQPDVLVIEEIDEEWIRQLESLAGEYPCRVTCPRDDNFGIGLYSRYVPLKSKILYLGEVGAPSVFAVIPVGTTNVFVMGTHPVPPANARYAAWRDEQLARIPEFLRTVESPVVLLGDLNMTPWSCRFGLLLRDARLANSARGWGVQPTWPVTPFFLRIPLDHCLISPGINVMDRRIGPDIGSDHYPLIVDLWIP